MIHFALAMVWTLLTVMLLVWRVLPDAQPPENLLSWVAGAVLLSLYNWTRFAWTMRGRRAPTPESTEPPPQPKVVDPTFDFSDRRDDERR